jgi:MFS family permease
MWLRSCRVTVAAAEPLPAIEGAPRLWTIIPVLGVTQILAWGSSYYLLAVLAKPIAADTGWSLGWVVGGLSFGLLVAGIVSPRVGDSIQRLGGRLILATSAVFLAAGLIGLALSPNLPLYVISWLVLGVGMGAGLYDAAFATLGRLYGQHARTAITTLTLFGGLASATCWPLSAILVSHFGWRNACLIYAGIHLVVLLPLYVFALPKEPRRAAFIATDASDERSGFAEAPVLAAERLLFVLIALVITISSMISALLSVHLLTILQARHVALTAAVALGAIVGPSQVGARLIEMLISRFHHPIWTKLASTLFVATGIGLLWIGLPVVAMALIFYGAGIESIARGTLPLAIFGEHRYPSIIGRIAMPSLIMQAASPSLGSILIERLGAHGALGALFAVALVNVLLSIVLFGIVSKRSRLAALSDPTVG